MGDFENGSKMFNGYAEVPPEMVENRAIVMARKEPRKILVQGHIQAKPDGGLELTSYASSASGMIDSFVARYPAEDPELLALYESEKAAVTD